MMNKGITLSIVFIFFITFFSCENNVQPISPDGFEAWIQNPEKGLHRKKEINGIVYDLQYLPLQHIEGEIEEKKSLDKIIIKFLLKMSNSQTNGPVLNYKLSNTDELMRRIEYLTHSFKEDIILINNNDTTQAIDVIYERSYNLSPYDSFLIMFEIDRLDELKEKTIVIEDKIFENNYVKLKIKESFLKSIPKIRK